MALEFIKPTYSAVKSVNGKVGAVEITAEDIGAATKEYVDEKAGDVDLTGLATEEYVAKKIAEAQLAESDVDLSAYYTKSEVDKQIETIELTPGPQGEKGDAFTYEDFTPEQLEALKGKDGYTPIKGVDYFDGEKGEPGEAGKDGYTPIKGVDYFDGEPGIDGAQGPQGEPGDKGDPGEKGEKGDKGDTYTLTEADKQAIAQLAIDLMPAAEEGAY